MSKYRTSANVDLQDKGTYPNIEDLFHEDSVEVPAHLLRRSSPPASNVTFSPEMFFSQTWHESEVEAIWKKTWQVACWVNEIPSPGDYCTYEIENQSIVIVRGKDSQI